MKLQHLTQSKQTLPAWLIANWSADYCGMAPQMSLVGNGSFNGKNDSNTNSTNSGRNTEIRSRVREGWDD